MRKFLALSIVLTLGAIGVWYATASEGERDVFVDLPPLNPPKDTPPPQTPFQNLSMLKHQSVSDLYTTMTYFNRSLGVACSHCHNLSAFYDDSLPNKVRTREMIEMVRDINGKYFKSERVLCFTCHQGGTHPARVPLATMMGDSRAMESKRRR